MSELLDRVRPVVDRAIAAYPGADPEARWARSVLHDARARLDGPLRVALAGTITSGKSTLLNALVGERVAATDAGECTKLVTWYRDAPRAAVHREGPDGRRPVPFVRGSGGLEIDMRGLGAAGSANRLVVDWPSRGLAATTLVDTPGLDSLDAGRGAATAAFVTPDDRPSGVDAVVYLMRHAHRDDVGFLETFADLTRGGAGGLGAVGAAASVVVLARADEIGGGRVDALTTAGQVARAHRDDPLLRPLCQTVVAVAGLLAETARTLRQDEFTALRVLARAPVADVDAMLLSVDRFVAAELPAGVVEAVAADPDGPRLDVAARRALLERLGVYGIRVATTVLRRGERTAARRGGPGIDSPTLAAELLRRSGLTELQEVLRTRVVARADVHQARSALLAVDRVLRRAPRPAAAAVGVELERVLAGAHAFTEQRLVTALRSGAVAMPGATGAEAERLLGGDGPGARARLGLEPIEDDAASEAPDWRPHARETLDRWRVLAESPLVPRAAAEVSRAVVRSLEELVVGGRDERHGPPRAPESPKLTTGR